MINDLHPYFLTCMSSSHVTDTMLLGKITDFGTELGQMWPLNRFLCAL